MAPESLSDGLYTHKSDVFGYGVICYEIFSCGSYPYQGLKNNEVMTYVESGNVIKLPDAISEELRSMILTCWNVSYCQLMRKILAKWVLSHLIIPGLYIIEFPLPPGGGGGN